MAALGNDFGRVLALVSRGEFHRRSTVARITQETQEQPEIRQRLSPQTVIGADRLPGLSAAVFRSWPGTRPCPRRSVHSARGPKDRRPSMRPEPALAGGALAAEERHNPQWRKILSITSACGGSIKATTSICPPHSHAGQGVDLVDALDEHRPTLGSAKQQSHLVSITTG